jgi:hypothetical protein
LSKETIFYEKQNFSQQHVRRLVAPGYGMQRQRTCIASKHETIGDHSAGDSHCFAHQRSTLASANDTSFARREFSPAPARRGCPCQLSGESCGANYPSIENVPTPGCWQIQFNGAASIIFWVIGN